MTRGAPSARGERVGARTVLGKEARYDVVEDLVGEGANVATSLGTHALAAMERGALVEMGGDGPGMEQYASGNTMSMSASNIEGCVSCIPHSISPTLTSMTTSLCRSMVTGS